MEVAEEKEEREKEKKKYKEAARKRRRKLPLWGYFRTIESTTSERV